VELHNIGNNHCQQELTQDTVAMRERAKTLDREKVLCAFAKLQKAIISIVMSVRLSAWNNSDPTGRIAMKFDI